MDPLAASPSSHSSSMLLMGDVDTLSDRGTTSQGPTIIIDRQLSSHLEKLQRQMKGSNSDLEESDASSPFLDKRSTLSLASYGSHSVNEPLRTIRFQVVFWYVGPVDVVLGRVTMKFRISLFWNNDLDDDPDGNHQEDHHDDSNTVVSKASTSMWRMQGRNKASQIELEKDSKIAKTIDVPPVSILNAVSMDVIGEPDVNVLREDTQLMRWSCMYKATLLQDNFRVDKFPHDEHELVLKLGILSQRRTGQRWDRHKWRLALATESDSLGSTRIPHGLIVDHVKIPEFSYGKQGLQFDFAPLSYGAEGGCDGLKNRDKCLQVKLHVVRDSGYYDQNIMPLLAMLNLVAISAVFCLDATGFFMRGLLLLNIAFTEIGIRMTIDSHLPNVGYQITMQRILNQFFFTLLYLVLESSILYYMTDRKGWSVETTDWIDLFVVMLAVLHTVITVVSYYREMHALAKKLRNETAGKV